MSAAKPTAGPWRYVTDCGTHVIRQSRNDGEFEGYVASTWGGENEADARLIAASPALLSIAQRWAALDSGDWHPTRWERDRVELLEDTRAAIAAATGSRE